jgi:hypothetical protein
MKIFSPNLRDAVATAESKVIDLESKIVAAKESLAHVKATAENAVLNNVDVDAAVSVSALASAKLEALAGAKSRADAEVAAARERLAGAERKERRDEAATKVRAWKQDAIELREKLLPLVREVRDLAVRHDGVGAGFANRPICAMVDPALASLYLPAEASATFDILLARLQQDDQESTSLANRILGFTMPDLAQID